ncbi:EamA family transporter [Streptomyces sp. NPDC007083]|uniref:EamA family transporter n=1 Tax=unclassified Streptomyces TaxID=2593676 RepID=UPI0033CD1298
MENPDTGTICAKGTRRGGQTARTPRALRVRDVPPHVYFVVSAVFHYLGPAFAILLFAHVQPLGVAWLRIATAAAVFAVWRRPWRRLPSADRATRRSLLAWGVLLAIMNSSFYLAIDRLPLGTVAAIEFLPVIVLATVALRSRRNLLALVTAVAGVYLLTDVHLAVEPLGLLFAGLNAALFALYIVLAHRASRNPGLSGIDGLALATLIASAAALPVGFGQAMPAMTDLRLLAAGMGVGICSSVIPYVCDQLAMARLNRGTYALLVSLLPASATVIGVLVLVQIPVPLEAAGVVLVVLGVAVHRELPPDGQRDPPDIRGEAIRAPPALPPGPDSGVATPPATDSFR